MEFNDKDEGSSSSLSRSSSEDSASASTASVKKLVDEETQHLHHTSSIGTSSAEGVQSWQETKTCIKDRTSYLLNSDRLSDILFEVGPNDIPIYGHKTILSAGSPYFEKLFYGPMATNESIIKIPDIEPDIFLRFLKYLYTDEFESNMDDVNTMLLLQPAKVYLVPHLADKCTELLTQRINADNVLIIYNRALIFGEPRLANLCLRFLDRQIDKVIETDGFLDIDLETLSTLLERQNLRVDECVLFKAVLKWTEIECQRKQVEATPRNRRQTLSSAIYLIRFPTMTREEFCIEVVPTKILEDKEIIEILMNMCIGEALKNHRPSTLFGTEKRIFKPKLHFLNRFTDILSKVINCNLGFSYTNSANQGDVLYQSKLRFRSDQRIFLHGIGLYGVSSPVPNTKFAASVTVSKGQTIVGVKHSPNGNARTYDFRIPFQVSFESPIEILANEEYHIAAQLKIVRDTVLNAGGGIILAGSSLNLSIDSYYGTKGKASVKTCCEDGVVVNLTFITPVTFHVADAFCLGQIPQIIFSV